MLQFNEGAYGQAYGQGQENEIKNKYQNIEALMRLSQQLSQTGQSMASAGQARQQQDQQKKLYELQLDEAQRKKLGEDQLDQTWDQLLSGNRLSEEVAPLSMLDKIQMPQGMGEAALPMGQQPGMGGGMRASPENFRMWQQGKLGPPQVNMSSSALQPSTDEQLASFGLPPSARGMTLRQTNAMGLKPKPMFAEAGLGDFANPDQTRAEFGGDPEALIRAYDGKVPKAAIGRAGAFQRSQESSVAREESRKMSLTREDEDRIRNIRNDIQGSQPYKDWRQIKNASDNLQNAAANPTAKRSLGALYSYVKALDPNSVVREGEISLSQEARSGFERVEGVFNKLAKGQVLNPDEIKEVAEWALEKEQMAKQSATDSNSPSINQAKRRGYDISEINEDLFGSSSSTQAKSLTATNPQTGEKIKSTDGGKTWQPM